MDLLSLTFALHTGSPSLQFKELNGVARPYTPTILEPKTTVASQPGAYPTRDCDSIHRDRCGSLASPQSLLLRFKFQVDLIGCSKVQPPRHLRISLRARDALSNCVNVGRSNRRQFPSLHNDLDWSFRPLADDGTYAPLC